MTINKNIYIAQNNDNNDNNGNVNIANLASGQTSMNMVMAISPGRSFDR